MFKRLRLTPYDIGEIISATLLAEMDYNQKLIHCQEQSIAKEFIPSTKTLQEPGRLLERIALQFTIDSTRLRDKSISQMSELIFAKTGGRPKQLTFFTSGSTGVPIPAVSRFADLEQEILSLSRLFTDRKRIVSFVPCHHIYGFLFSILLPKALRIPVEYRAVLPGKDQIKTMVNGDLVIAFPLLWKKLGKLNCRFTENVYGVTSTGPCPAENINNLQKQGLARMTEVYGSSETGGVGFRHDPAYMYTLFEHWKKSGDSTIERTSTDGTKQLHTLQDNLEWQDTQFKPLNRSDNAVQVGGINVYPSRVKHILMKNQHVRDCAVRLMRPEEGERLKSFIVPVDGVDLAELEKELRMVASTELSSHEKPGKYDFGPSIPLSKMGKLSDW
ncbi:AMP-binding enzyme [Maridesulfovibrio sp. FT414]|uniref:AMP-binding enzyme n=1 Tax=Maridesulfovibrio sp. FT414 TaxID=2979469 RepID=UPI003D806BAA